MGKLDDRMAAARRQGATATAVVRSQVWAQRELGAGVNASEAYAQQSASGVGPRSVWTGPRRAARAGEPILRRAR